MGSEIMNIEYHLLELRDEGSNVKKVIAVIDATFAVAKRKPEKQTNKKKKLG